MEESFNQLYSRYNTDNVFNRVVIIGLLDLLNNHMHYEQIWDDNVVENISVPFMYDFGSSDERFAQDNYTFFGSSCFNQHKITGKFDMLPRGAVKYSGSNIDASNITNRYVKGTFMKNENGKLTSYTAMMYSIPLSFSFDCEMWIDNIITAFKIEQSIRDTFYKNKTYNVLYRGMKIGCTVGFPEQTTLDKTTSYSFDSERQIKINFSLAVETYQPSFDMSTAIETGKTMEHILYDVETLNSANSRRQSVTITNLKETKQYFKNHILPIRWTYESSISDMCTLKIIYVDEEEVEHLIDVVPANIKEYDWIIPNEISEFEQPTIIFDDYENVVSEPKIEIIPIKGKITKESFTYFSLGRFKIDGKYSTTIDYTDVDGNVVMSNNFVFNVLDGVIDLNNPVELIDDSKELEYRNTYKNRHISIKIEYGLDKEINDKSANLLII